MTPFLLVLLGRRSGVLTASASKWETDLSPSTASGESGVRGPIAPELVEPDYLPRPGCATIRHLLTAASTASAKDAAIVSAIST
jgi:hypothetical protein